MVEVDPMLLFTAGTIAVGLATAALCLRSSSGVADKDVSNVKVTQQASVVKPKKKQARPAKKVAPPAEVIVLSEELEIAAIMKDLEPTNAPQKAAKKPKELSKADAAALKKTAEAAAKAAAKALKEEEDREEEEAREEAEAEALAEKILAAEEEEKKSKKAKETSEQKAARLERVRLVKVRKMEEEELSKAAAIELATAESRLLASLPDTSVSVVTHADGWAVVEDKRKVKAKAMVTVVEVTAAATDSDAPIEPIIPADFVKSEMSVDSKKIGIIIGPKGVTLHGIQDATGVEINTPKGDRDGSATAVISISGTADGVAVASIAIHELCTKGYCKLLAGDDFKEGSIDVHPIYLSEIIGKGGLNVRAIQDFTGVKLSIPQVKRDHVLPVRVLIAGNKDKVQEAKDIITELTTYYHSNVTHPGQVHAEMDVDPSMYNNIIGSKGAEIKQIQVTYKVQVHIPNGESVTKNVLIVGDPAGVKGAEKRIQKIVEAALADREAAEKMADSWVDDEGEAGQPGWNGFPQTATRPQAVEGAPTPLSGIAGTAAAIAAASASAWGASILTSADGW